MPKANLSGVNASALHIAYGDKKIDKPTRFCMVNLSRARAIKADFSRADFSGAILRDTDFSGCNLTDANFENTDVTGMIVRGATYDLAQFTKAVGFDSAKR
jgi:uncharacterized protein YjbI with pentapeptide repeats